MVAASRTGVPKREQIRLWMAQLDAGTDGIDGLYYPVK
jgi:hypothetical protein